jgi:hypothetical protein
MNTNKSQTEQLTQDAVIRRFDLKHDDIYEIYNIAKKHIEELNTASYANIEDEKNQIRNALREILSVVLNGL